MSSDLIYAAALLRIRYTDTSRYKNRNKSVRESEGEIAAYVHQRLTLLACQYCMMTHGGRWWRSVEVLVHFTNYLGIFGHDNPPLQFKSRTQLTAGYREVFR